jgi:hypothetical protein
MSLSDPISVAVFCQTYEKKGKGQNIENQNVVSQKEQRKFEKDQNVESQIRLSTF